MKMCCRYSEVSSIQAMEIIFLNYSGRNLNKRLESPLLHLGIGYSDIRYSYPLWIWKFVNSYCLVMLACW